MPGDIPAGPEHDTITAKDNIIAGRPVLRIGGVASPSLTVYPAAHPNGQAVVVFPGGGYHILALDLEGNEVCDWLNSIDVTCVLVKYRVPAQENPTTTPPNRYPGPLMDAQRAMGLVRQHAAEWHIDPNRVGVLGFSAGGHLSAHLSTNFATRTYPEIDAADRLSCRPDFAIIIYPGYIGAPETHYTLAPELPVTKDTPPTFLVQAEDDPVHVENSVTYFLALKNAGVPAELHLYTKGGHGYGLRPTANPVTGWPKLAAIWMQGLNGTAKWGLAKSRIAKKRIAQIRLVKRRLARVDLIRCRR